MSAILEFFGVAPETAGLELVFVLCALIGGGLFLLWFMMTMFLGGLGDIAEGVFDFEIGDSDMSFKALTLQGILAFVMMFGLTGHAAINAGSSHQMSMLAGFIAGLFSLWVVGKLFEGFQKLEMSGNVDAENAIGASGSVYLKIPAEGEGKVEVNFQGKRHVRDAVSKGGEEIPTGALIEVVGLVGDRLQVVAVNVGAEEE